jgi:electron transport complex protein RnfG
MEPRENQLSRRTIVIGSFVPIVIVCLLGSLGIHVIGKKLEQAHIEADEVRAIRWIQNIAGDQIVNIERERIVEVVAPRQLGTPRSATLYLSNEENGFSQALRWIAEDGYNGPIELAATIHEDGSIVEFQVISQNETPGFGDIVQDPDQVWIQAFRGRSLDNPSRERWLLRADGGSIDGLSGATITANAIVRGVSNALQFLSDTDSERQ